jgi:hypothetical protein
MVKTDHRNRGTVKSRFLNGPKQKGLMGCPYILAQVSSPRHLHLNSYQDQPSTFGIQAFEGEGDAFHKEKQ